MYHIDRELFHGRMSGSSWHLWDRHVNTEGERDIVYTGMRWWLPSCGLTTRDPHASPLVSNVISLSRRHMGREDIFVAVVAALGGYERQTQEPRPSSRPHDGRWVDPMDTPF